MSNFISLNIHIHIMLYIFIPQYFQKYEKQNFMQDVFQKEIKKVKDLLYCIFILVYIKVKHYNNNFTLI